MSFSDVSGASKYFVTPNEGFSTTTSGTVASGAATVGLNSVAGLTNGSTFVGVIEPAGTKEQIFTGVVDTAGSQITGVAWTKGSNIDHATGVSVVDYDTGTALKLMTTGIKKEHNDNGTHAAVTATSVTATGALTGSSLVNAAHTHANAAGGGQIANSGISGVGAEKLSNPYKFSVYRNAAWTCGTSLATIVFDTKDFDTGTNFATGTGLFTAPIAGFYWFNTQVAATTSNGGNNLGQIILIKNGSTQFAVGGWNIGAVSTNAYGGGGRLLSLAANDTVGVQATSSISITGLTGTLYTHFDGALVSAT